LPGVLPLVEWVMNSQVQVFLQQFLDLQWLWMDVSE
jgi:hypothetical protein